MDAISKFISVAIVAIFAENIVFVHALGTSVVLEAVRSVRTYLKMFFVLTVISAIASGVSYFVDKSFFARAYPSALLPVIYVLILSAVYIAILLILYKLFPSLFSAIKKYIHLCAFNCAIFGSLFINTNSGGSFVSYIGFGFGTGIGLMLALLLVYIGSEKLKKADIPKAFEGMPAMLIYIGVLSAVFYGLTI